jgi:hypothetical protein
MEVRRHRITQALVMAVLTLLRADGAAAEARASEGEHAAAAIDFDTQIIPVLTRAGCNTGACHGAAIGRGGMILSLYGSDPAADHRALAHQWEGRRVNLARPERSLLFRKPAGEMDHGGDQRFQPDDESARLLLEWIAQGGRRLASRELVEVSIAPSQHAAVHPGESFALRVTARFSDGSRDDVTRWTVLTPEDPAALRVGEDQQVTVERRGRHLLLARYLDRVLPVVVSLPLREVAVEETAERAPPANDIDRFIEETLRTLGLTPSEPIDDAGFLRRVSLDLRGRLPSPGEIREFLQDGRDDRRRILIDRFLASDEFVTFWTWRLATLLRNRGRPDDDVGARTFHEWIRRQLAEHRPFDEWAVALLTAAGDTHTQGEANFFRVSADPREDAEFISEVLMGVRLRCANCHNHPLDRWTQDDYHGLAAIFAGIERGQIIRTKPGGTVVHPRTEEPAIPRIPGERFLDEAPDARAALAEWLTADTNRYFARAIVNRLWAALMGRGLVEPVDDLRETNPGTHPELLDWLARDFIAHGYDLRHTLGVIARSAAYQRSPVPADPQVDDDSYYSRFLTHPLEPEVLADAIADVLGVAERYGEEPVGTRAIELFHPGIEAPSLDVLGRCPRDGSCDPSLSPSAGVSVQLHLLNGGLLNDRLTRDTGHLAQAIRPGGTDGHAIRELVREFYIRGLSRAPNDAELDGWKRQLTATAGGPTRPDSPPGREAFEDFLWALLTSREFTTNH